ncbi:hypothetical protein VNO78_17065 [Psophocarpus tetragonolobus]|uniref:Uncharacterized protein n=1 Tax=Psophocarpus tetragonolobus TaxID=3891 RepID=A0AAN9SI01_PSOTE
MSYTRVFNFSWEMDEGWAFDQLSYWLSDDVKWKIQELHVCLHQMRWIPWFGHEALPTHGFLVRCHVINIATCSCCDWRRDYNRRYAILHFIAGWTFWQICKKQLFNMKEVSLWDAFRHVYALQASMCKAYAMSAGPYVEVTSVTHSATSIFANVNEVNLHVDDSLLGQPSLVGVGALMRDASGNGYMAFLSVIDLYLQPSHKPKTLFQNPRSVTLHLFTSIHSHTQLQARISEDFVDCQGFSLTEKVNELI